MRAYFGVPPGTKVNLTWRPEGLFQQPASFLLIRVVSNRAEECHCEARFGRADDSVASGEWQSGGEVLALHGRARGPPPQIATLVLSPVEGSATPPRNRTCPWRRGTTRDEDGSARSLRSQISSSLRTLQSLNDLKGFSKGRAAAFENLSPQRVGRQRRLCRPSETGNARQRRLCRPPLYSIPRPIFVARTIPTFFEAATLSPSALS